MSVGLMDADLATYVPLPFNLEIMKLSAYYKARRQLVVLAPDFYPDRHQLFIYRKDYEDGIYPTNLLNTPNVQYGGLAFSHNRYVALPEEIERMKPDTTIYENMAERFKCTKKATEAFRSMMAGEHARISLDGKTVWPDYGRQFKNLRNAKLLLLHDYNLAAIENGFETVKEILTRARTDGWATRVGMKFPVTTREGKDLLNWSSLRTSGIFYSMRYDGIMDDDTFNSWLALCHERAVYTQMEYHVTAPWYEPNQFIKEGLPKILRQIIISRSYRVFFSLVYDRGFFFDPKWEEVLQLMSFYLNSYTGEKIALYSKKLPNDTLFDFAAHCKNETYKYNGKFFTQDHIREIFAFVRDNHPALFNDFYECTAKKLGGKL